MPTLFKISSFCLSIYETVSIDSKFHWEKSVQGLDYDEIKVSNIQIHNYKSYSNFTNQLTLTSYSEGQESLLTNLLILLSWNYKRITIEWRV